MGLINFFKKMFTKKVITLPVKRRDVLIQPLSSGYSRINLGQKLVVDSGWSAVIVAKDTVLDVFKEGTYELSLAYLPKTTKILKLDKGKVKKSGLSAEVILPTSFKCDLYFVRTEYIQGRKWESDLVRVREKDKKHLKYQLKGNYSFQVQAPDKVVGLFLIDWAKIKTGKSIVKLDSLVGDVCTEVLWKKKISSKNQLVEYDFANTTLKPVVYKNFIKYGLCVTDMQVEKVIYPEDFKGEHFSEVTPEIFKSEDKSEKSTVSTSGENLLENETEKLLNGSSDEKSEDSDDLVQKLESNQGNQPKRQIPFYSFSDSTKRNENYKTPSTLNEETELVCKHCGAKVPQDSKFCNKCGNIIKEN